MKNILYAFLMIASVFFISSCSNNEDKDAPSIEILKPQENEVVETGKNLNMKFRFKDEYGVHYYSYELFHEDGQVQGEFTYKKELDVETVLNEFEISHSVQIPLMNRDSVPTATGNYILRVVAVDWYYNKNYVDRVIKIVKNTENQ